MPQSRKNSPTKAGPKTTFLQPQTSTYPPSPSKMMHKSSTNNASSVVTEKMNGKTPVEIGTRGTVGSLIMQEIEFFTQLEINCMDSSQKKAQSQMPDAGSCPRPKLGSVISTPKKKKKKGSSRLIPSMCSMVDVVEKKDQPNMSSGFCYRTLKADIKTTLQV